MNTSQKVDRICIASVAREPIRQSNEALALVGLGLDADRYAAGIGSFSRWPGAGRAVSLIEGEALDVIFEETGIDLRPSAARRNIVTRGIRLEQLIDKVFRIGGAVFRGDRQCLPCRHVERLTVAGAFDALRDSGGLRADVLESGLIRINDEIQIVPRFPIRPLHASYDCPKGLQ